MPYDDELTTYDYSDDFEDVFQVKGHSSKFDSCVETVRRYEAERSIAWGNMNLALGKFYSAPQAAQLLHITINRIVNRIKSGDLPGINILGKWYVLRSIVDSEVE